MICLFLAFLKEKKCQRLFSSIEVKLNKLKDSIKKSLALRDDKNYSYANQQNSTFDADYVRNKLENADTPIMVSTEPWETELTEAKDDVIVLGPGALQKGEPEIIAEELKQILTNR